jgi:O-antigen ligase
LACGAAHLDGIDENATALVLAVGFAALIYVAMHFDGRRAVFLGLIAAETGVATLRTGSRSGAIAASVVLLVALLQLIRQRRMRSVLMFRTAAMLLLVCASFIWALNAGLLPQRVASLLNFGPVSDSGRSGIIDLYLTTFDHWALFGVGLNADAQYLFLTHSWYKNAHSMFWKTWIESGVVGLILIAAFLSVVIERGFRSVASQALILMAVPIFVFAITLGVLSTSVFWFVIALALAQRSEELRPAEPPPSGTLSAAAPRC